LCCSDQVCEPRSLYERKDNADPLGCSICVCFWPDNNPWKGLKMKENRALVGWGAVCAFVSGLVMIAPLIFYFFVLPAAGSSPTHAALPAQFLPWMAEHGRPRALLWWIVAAAFGVMLLGVPMGLRARSAELEDPAPTARAMMQIADRVGVLGCFTVVLACLMLAAGEPVLARAYVRAAPEVQPAIVATYQWQRLVTALLFDVLGFTLVGAWIAAGCAAGLRARKLPAALGGVGIMTGLLCLCVAAGYLLKVRWLGEMGLGAVSFVAVPVWLIWLGVTLIKQKREQAL